MAQVEGKDVPQCQVIEREEDGRWVLCVNGRPRLVLPAELSRVAAHSSRP
jgi:hypothetical protein